MKKNELNAAQVLYCTLVIQVCVPEEWGNDKIKEFVEGEDSYKTMSSWEIRKQGNLMPAVTDERVVCLEVPGCVHVILEA